MKTAITLLISIILALVLGECLLRVIGSKPWSNKRADAHEPTMHAPDSLIGWRSKKGSYVVPPYHPAGTPIHYTFEHNGQRRTGVESADPDSIDGEMVIVGGSFSQGWAVSDSETYAWKLQHKYPSLKVVNYGTAGYGTYQSLLVLERELPRMTSPRFVLYGFISHHEVRNVAPESWLRTLSAYSRRGHVNAPFATFDDQKGIIRHPPEGYLSLPFRESLALIALVERAYMRTTTRGRHKQRRVVTEALLLEMDRVCKAYGAELFMVLFSARDNDARHYMGFCEKSSVNVVDCRFPPTTEMVVPGEGHPNGRMHSVWTQRIAGTLDDHLEKANPGNEGVGATH